MIFFQILINGGSLISAYSLEYFPKKNNRRATFIREIRVTNRAGWRPAKEKQAKPTVQFDCSSAMDVVLA